MVSTGSITLTVSHARILLSAQLVTYGSLTPKVNSGSEWASGKTILSELSGKMKLPLSEGTRRGYAKSLVVEISKCG
jgi:hypothetical protein